MFRGPLLWIILGTILVVTVLQFVSSSGGYEDVDTSELARAMYSTDAFEPGLQP